VPGADAVLRWGGHPDERYAKAVSSVALLYSGTVSVNISVYV